MPDRLRIDHMVELIDVDDSQSHDVDVSNQSMTKDIDLINSLFSLVIFIFQLR